MKEPMCNSGSTISNSWSVLVRLYGPLEPWFDKSWKPGDIELVDG